MHTYTTRHIPRGWGLTFFLYSDQMMKSSHSLKPRFPSYSSYLTKTFERFKYSISIIVISRETRTFISMSSISREVVNEE